LKSENGVVYIVVCGDFAEEIVTLVAGCCCETDGENPWEHSRLNDHEPQVDMELINLLYGKCQSEALGPYSPNSTWLVTSLHDTYDVSSVSSVSWRACRAVLSDKRDTAEIDGLDSVSCCVVTW